MSLGATFPAVWLLLLSCLYTPTEQTVGSNGTGEGEWVEEGDKPRHSRHVHKFEEWLQEQGVRGLHRVQVQPVPGAGLGVVSRVPLPCWDDSPLVHIPSNLFITRKTVLQGPLSSIDSGSSSSSSSSSSNDAVGEEVGDDIALQLEKVAARTLRRYIDSLPSISPDLGPSQARTTALLTLWLLQRVSGPRSLVTNSYWRPWLNVLPVSLHTALYVADTQMELLRGSATLDALGDAFADIVADYQWIFGIDKRKQGAYSTDIPIEYQTLLLREWGDVFTPEMWSWDRFAWAASIVRSRAYTYTLKIGPSDEDVVQETVLIPLIDMFNHRPTHSANAAFHVGNRKFPLHVGLNAHIACRLHAVTQRGHRVLPPGHELAVSYDLVHRLGDAVKLAIYGFLPTVSPPVPTHPYRPRSLHLDDDASVTVSFASLVSKSNRLFPDYHAALMSLLEDKGLGLESTLTMATDDIQRLIMICYVLRLSPHDLDYPLHANSTAYTVSIKCAHDIVDKEIQGYWLSLSNAYTLVRTTDEDVVTPAERQVLQVLYRELLVLYHARDHLQRSLVLFTDSYCQQAMEARVSRDIAYSIPPSDIWLCPALARPMYAVEGTLGV